MEKKNRKKGDVVFYKGEACYIEFCCSTYYGSDYKVKSCSGAYSFFVDEKDITDSPAAKYSVGEKVIYKGGNVNSSLCAAGANYLRRGR